MSDLGLIVISAVCFVAALATAVIALRMKPGTRGQQVLLRVTRDYRGTRIIDNKSSFKARLLAPIGSAMLHVGKRVTPAERMSRLERRLEDAGYPHGLDVSKLLIIKGIGIICFPTAWVGALVTMVTLTGGSFLASPTTQFVCFIGLLLSPVIGYYAPEYWLSKVAEKRKAQINRSLSDIVDMLNLTLAAGISFDSALRLVADNTDGPLSQDFARVVQETAIGKSRAEALRSLSERTNDEDLRRFCTICIQAERRGTPFSEILSVQSRELRIKRRQLAEERAQKVPIKILFPMMIFVLPTLMIVVLGPAIIQIATSGLGGTPR